MLRINFEFIGGPNDGKLLHGTLGESSDAERYYLISNRGAVGQPFSVASPFAVETLVREQLQNEQRHYFQRHIYAVTDRIETDKEVSVRAEYVLKRAEPNWASSCC
jgi:hypothetical protein